MREIASWLVAALVENGHEAQLCLTGVPHAAPGLLNLVVAPHEYFELDFDPALRARAAAACVPISTEQPGTPWFEIQLASLAHSPMVLDINPMGVAELARRGIPVAHLPLGYRRGFDRWGGPAAGSPLTGTCGPSRPIDVLFLGSLTTRREAVLASLASDLQSMRCRLVLFESTRPARQGDAGFYSGTAKHELLASAKVLLNVHRNDVPYFESVRALEAVANGAVLLSEPSLDHGLFEPVRHVVTAPLASLGATCRALVADDHWLEEVRGSAYEHLRAHPLAAELQRLWPRLLAATGSEVLPRLAWMRGAPAARAARSVLATSAVARSVHARLEPPAAEAGPPPPPGGVTDGLFKRVLLGQMQLRRRLDEIECLVRHGATRFDETFCSAAYHKVRPDVSVVIPCYNYGRFVIDAIDSVACSVDVVPEIIVIDDHSEDGSSECVRRYAQSHDWVPLQIVTRHANSGLAAARNLGFELARAPYVFPLDADNLLYPHALARLTEALLCSGAAAAYGILEVFNDRQGLLSAIDWSVERLVAGPYIDAAALIRKDAWAAIGGYATDRPELFGWEDYDLWLNLADQGLGAAFVPELLVRYRSHGASMIHTTNIDTLSVAALLRRRYRNLPWPELAA